MKRNKLFLYRFRDQQKVIVSTFSNRSRIIGAKYDHNSYLTLGSKIRKYRECIPIHSIQIQEQRVEIHGGEESRQEVLRWRHIQVVLGCEHQFLNLCCNY